VSWRKFSCDALLPAISVSTPITFLFFEPYSHGLHLSVLCGFLIGYVGDGVMTNDRWCRDETESLLWCTHGWAARHALVLWLIVVIHYETILMCYLLWTFSQSDRCILSQHVAIFYPNLSSVYFQIPSHEFAYIFSLGVTCFSTLKDPHSNLGTRFL
jgi:energy-coupling factor transporter transmembrane protein EcfT